MQSKITVRLKLYINSALKKTFAFPFLIVLCIFFSCEYYGKKELVLAEVDGEELTFAQVKNVLGENVHEKDINVKLYVNQWVRDKVVLQAAQKLLSPSEKDFKEEIENYNNSLLRYALESKYISEQVDTNVSELEVKEYYKNNLANFELKQNIVKVRWVEFPKSFKKKEELKKGIQFADSVGEIKFVKWCKKNRVKYFGNDTTWKTFEDLRLMMPIKIYDEENFLSNQNLLETQSDQTSWLIYFSAYRLKDAVSPFEAVKEKIKSILINKNKLTIIKEMEKQLYQKAVKKGQIKLYLNP